MKIAITNTVNQIEILSINYTKFNSNGKETIVIFKFKDKQKVEVLRGWLNIDKIVEKLDLMYL